MVRKFVYNAKPEVVADYLRDSGYEIEYVTSRDGKEVIGFSVIDTTVQLSYDLDRNGLTIGRGMISLRHSILIPDPQDPHNKLVDEDPERYQRSLRLYRKLYQKFSKPHPI